MINNDLKNMQFASKSKTSVGKKISVDKFTLLCKSCCEYVQSEIFRNHVNEELEAKENDKKAHEESQSEDEFKAIRPASARVYNRARR